MKTATAMNAAQTRRPDATGDDDGCRTGGHDFRAVTELPQASNKACREILSSS